MQDFWRELSANSDPQYLKAVQFSVYGLGNRTRREQFNTAAKSLEEKCRTLGARHLCNPVYGCEFDNTGYENSFYGWVNDVCMALNFSLEDLHEESSAEPLYKVQVLKHSIAHPPAGFSLATIKSRTVVTASEYPRRIYQLTFEVPHNTVYRPGDSLAIFPRTSRESVDTLLSFFGWDPNTYVAYGRY